MKRPASTWFLLFSAILLWAIWPAGLQAQTPGQNINTNTTAVIPMDTNEAGSGTSGQFIIQTTLRALHARALQGVSNLVLKETDYAG